MAGSLGDQVSGDMDRRTGTTRGIRWAYPSMAMAYAAQPIVLILLARVLTPADFGLLAMALALITFLELFKDMGLGQALIRHQGSGRELASSVFWAHLAFGAATFALVWAAAPLVGMYYQNEQVVPVLRAMGVVFLLYPFIDVPYAFLLRDLQFKALFLRQAVPAVMGGAVSVGLGYTGFGVWSLVAGMLAGRAIAGVVSLWVSRWLPALRFDPAATLAMLRFGSQISLQKVLGWAIVWSDRWFVGRFLGTASLGIYQVGMRLGELPFIASGAPLTLVAYPVMARVGHDVSEVRRRYLSYLRGVALIGLPFGVGLVLLMPFAVPGILGEQWSESVGIFQILLLTQTLASLVSLNPEVFKALGKPHIMSRFMAVRAAVSVPIYFLAAQSTLTTLAMAHLVLVMCFAPINMAITMHMVHIGVGQTLASLRSGLVVAVAVGVVGLLYWWQGARVMPGDSVSTAVLALLLVGSSLVAVFLVDRRAIWQLLTFVRPDPSPYQVRS